MEKEKWILSKLQTNPTSSQCTVFRKTNIGGSPSALIWESEVWQMTSFYDTSWVLRDGDKSEGHWSNESEGCWTRRREGWGRNSRNRADFHKRVFPFHCQQGNSVAKSSRAYKLASIIRGHGKFMENMFVKIFAAFQYTHLTIICFLQLSSFKCTF